MPWLLRNEHNLYRGRGITSSQPEGAAPFAFTTRHVPPLSGVTDTMRGVIVTTLHFNETILQSIDFSSVRYDDDSNKLCSRAEEQSG